VSGILALLHPGILKSEAETGPRPFPAPEVLERLTAAMEYRAPEGSGSWSEGPTGLGHALLRTHTPGEQTEPGVVRDPDTGLAIVADARLDDRGELVRKLRNAGIKEAGGVALWPQTPAPRLLLAAYRVWGSNCPDHLLGDFAFVIWDASQRVLFAARDPFGVKPLFVAEIPGEGDEIDWVLISNTLPAVLAHPGVTLRPDLLAVGDYLLFGSVNDEVLTPFADVRQVPRGTTLEYSGEGRRALSYWSLPEPGEIRFRRTREYVEHFGSLLNQAVADRLPALGHTAVVELSGGLDSGSIACAATEVRRGADLHALSVGYERLFPDPEVPLSKATASVLGLPHTLLLADDWVEPLPGLARALPEWASTSGAPLPLAPGSDLADVFSPPVARLGRVALAGWDGDALLYGSTRAAFLRSLRQGRLLRVARDLGALAREGVVHRRPPRTGLRTALRQTLSGKKPDPLDGYPANLLDPEFQEGQALRERWAAAGFHASEYGNDPRARARSTLEGPVWSTLFQSYDPGFTGQRLETRHPLMDLRLVEFFLGLPVIPWCVEKGILRAYLRTRLPPAIWRRRKQGLQVDPVILRLREVPVEELKKLFWIGPDDPVRDVVSHPENLGALVAQSLKPGAEDLGLLYGAIRLHTLNHWLNNLRRSAEPVLE